jgi:hypothetical protein
MASSRVIPLGALALLAAVGAPLRAQAATQIQLAFGYECGDRFIVRNDGTLPVLVEYAVAGSQDRSELHLNGKQSAEIASAQDGNLDLWVGGKLVASEPKGDRPCAAGGNAQRGDTAVAPPPNKTPAPDSTAAPPPDKTPAPGPATQPDSATTSVPAVFAYAPPTDYFIYPPNSYDDFNPYYPRPSIGMYGNGGSVRGGVGRSVGHEGSGGRGHR